LLVFRPNNHANGLIWPLVPIKDWRKSASPLWCFDQRRDTVAP
jgi:hypothetical protein